MNYRVLVLPPDSCRIISALIVLI